MAFFMKNNSTYRNHSKTINNSLKPFSPQVNVTALHVSSLFPDSDCMLAYPLCKMEYSQFSGHVIPPGYDPADESARLKTLCL